MNLKLNLRLTDNRVAKYLKGETLDVDFDDGYGAVLVENCALGGFKISKEKFNQYTKMAIICPITTNTKKFPTHYELLSTKKIKGSVLCEHIRSIDFNARKLSFVEKIEQEEFEEIIDVIISIIEI